MRGEVDLGEIVNGWVRGLLVLSFRGYVDKPSFVCILVLVSRCQPTAQLLFVEYLHCSLYLGTLCLCLIQ